MPSYRLRRLDQVFSPQPIFFLTACTHDRLRLLANPETHRAFIEFSENAQRRGVSVGRYVLMPDHLHLFAALAPTAPSLAIWMKSLKNTLSKTLRGQGVQSPHWQKGFFDHVLRSDESYEEKWKYVGLNPVRVGLVGRSEDWPYQGEVVLLERWL